MLKIMLKAWAAGYLQGNIFMSEWQYCYGFERTPYHHSNYCIAIAVITLHTNFEIVNCLRYGTFSEYFLLGEAIFQHANRLYLLRFSKNFQMLQFCFRGLSMCQQAQAGHGQQLAETG